MSHYKLLQQTAGMGGQDFRAHFGRTGGRQQQGQNQGQGQGGILQQLMQFLPIVMLVLMSFSSLGGGQQQQVSGCDFFRCHRSLHQCAVRADVTA